MDLYTAIKSRYSARSYEARPVEEDKLGRILAAVRLAPSARNDQEWRFVVVRDAALRRGLMSAAYGQAFIGEAPVVIAACAENDGRLMSCGQPAYTIDAAIAIDHLTLAATAEGLATCWVCRFSEPEAKKVLGIPAGDNVRVIALVPLGYAKDRPPESKSRLPLDVTVHYEHWGRHDPAVG